MIASSSSSSSFSSSSLSCRWTLIKTRYPLKKKKERKKEFRGRRINEEKIRIIVTQAIMINQTDTSNYKFFSPSSSFSNTRLGISLSYREVINGIYEMDRLIFHRN